MERQMLRNQWAEKAIRYYVRKEISSAYDCYALYKYTLEDGKQYHERVQFIAGNSIFLALQDVNGKWVKISLWEEYPVKTAQTAVQNIQPSGAI